MYSANRKFYKVALCIITMSDEIHNTPSEKMARTSVLLTQEEREFLDRNEGLKLAHIIHGRLKEMMILEGDLNSLEFLKKKIEALEAQRVKLLAFLDFKGIRGEYSEWYIEN